MNNRLSETKKYERTTLYKRNAGESAKFERIDY